MTTFRFEETLTQLETAGNLRTLPAEADGRLIDLSSNDYMSIAENRRLSDKFFQQYSPQELRMSSSASRLLSGKQEEFIQLEQTIASLFGRHALLFNSGYHANTGIISAIAGKETLIIADRLVHASIIDGIILSRSPFVRFRHNDFNHLQQIIDDNYNKYHNILIIVESIYSMDGDLANLPLLAKLKKQYPGIMLYADEAHAFGVRGEKGLGIAEETSTTDDIDFIIGTFGKAAASSGAFVVTSEAAKSFLINKARSLIFSTALPPMTCLWTRFVIEHLVDMSDERKRLLEVSEYLNESFSSFNGETRSHSQIVPVITGDSKKAVELSAKLRTSGYLALPIRRPTVPPGTERIRLSINASVDMTQARILAETIKRLV